MDGLVVINLLAYPITLVLQCSIKHRIGTQEEHIICQHGADRISVHVYDGIVKFLKSVSDFHSCRSGVNRYGTSPFLARGEKKTL